jgi:hypothetical protein
MVECRNFWAYEGCEKFRQRLSTAGDSVTQRQNYVGIGERVESDLIGVLEDRILPSLPASLFLLFVIWSKSLVRFRRFF